MSILCGKIKKEGSIFVLFNKRYGFSGQCFGYFIIFPKCRLSTFHKPDTGDSVDNTHIMPVRRVHNQQLRIILTGRFTREVLFVTHLDRIGRINIDHLIVFYKYTRHTITGGSHNKRIVKTNIIGTRFQGFIPILFASLISQAKMPFTYHSGCIAALLKHIRHSITLRTDD